jgi:hypothetical protein
MVRVETLMDPLKQGVVARQATTTEFLVVGRVLRVFFVG